MPNQKFTSDEPLRAVEFFSGIGAFAEACRRLPVSVVAAYDQSEAANASYLENFNLAPCTRNLDSIRTDDIPDAHIWWMSPPCKPYTRRGLQLDDTDSRARSLLNVLEILPEKLPALVFLENVLAFEDSRMYLTLLALLRDLGYLVTVIHLCPTEFGVPMKRPRLFISALHTSFAGDPRLTSLVGSTPPASARLADYLGHTYPQSDLQLDPRLLDRYEKGLNIVDPSDDSAVTICFTSGYWRSMRASGSFLACTNGVRRFAPEEILRLLGFSARYQFPVGIDLAARWRLTGNSVDVRCILRVLSSIGNEAHAKSLCD